MSTANQPPAHGSRATRPRAKGAPLGPGSLLWSIAGDPRGLLPGSAAGIMQLMPGTAVRFGVRNRFVVQENIRGGVAYLAWLKQKFNGDLRLITAAYYVGEYAISSRGLEYSSPDVQGYVKRVAQRYRARRVLRARSQLARQRE